MEVSKDRERGKKEEGGTIYVAFVSSMADAYKRCASPVTTRKLSRGWKTSRPMASGPVGNGKTSGLRLGAPSRWDSVGAEPRGRLMFRTRVDGQADARGRAGIRTGRSEPICRGI